MASVLRDSVSSHPKKNKFIWVFKFTNKIRVVEFYGSVE
jgi:hypothetical protein